MTSAWMDSAHVTEWRQHEWILHMSQNDVSMNGFCTSHKASTRLHNNLDKKKKKKTPINKLLTFPEEEFESSFCYFVLDLFH